MSLDDKMTEQDVTAIITQRYVCINTFGFKILWHAG